MPITVLLIIKAIFGSTVVINNASLAAGYKYGKVCSASFRLKLCIRIVRVTLSCL